MNKQKTITLWIIGILCTLVWFWGAKAEIPASAINLAAWIVPGLLAYALKTSESSLSPEAKSTPTISQTAINSPVLPSVIKSAEIMPPEPSIIAGPAGGGGAASEVQS